MTYIKRVHQNIDNRSKYGKILTADQSRESCRCVHHIIPSMLLRFENFKTKM